MNLFETDDYKKALQQAMAERKSVGGSSVTYQSMAKAARMQKTYLSKVLHDASTHLSADQLFHCCQYLSLGKAECRYLELLLERARSTSRERKRSLTRQVEEIRDAALRSETVLQTINTHKEAESSGLMAVFLDPVAQLVLMMLTIPEYSLHPNRIAAALAPPPDRIRGCLESILAGKAARMEGGRLIPEESRSHLSRDSSLFPAYATSMRAMLAGKMAMLRHPDDYSFAVCFSGTDEMRRAIHARFLEFLAEVRERTEQCAAPDSVFQMAFDLVRWT